jgi:transcription elongation factor GreA
MREYQYVRRKTEANFYSTTGVKLERIPLTRQGYEKLKKELQFLKSVERPQTIKAIEEARAHGDLSENAEYDAAKNRQGFVEGRIGELGYKIGNAEIIDPEKLPKDQAVFGCRVLLENVDTGEQIEYQLVGSEESDIDKGRISVSSPLGKAILGKKPGDEVSVRAPGGKRNYELVEIL